MIRQVRLAHRSICVGAICMLLAWLLAAPALSQRVANREEPPPADPQPQAPADEKPATSFASAPRTANDLRQLQARVQEVVKIAMPATVGIASPLGLGSGVIVSKDGLILTAGHVAQEGGFEVRIILADGRAVRGRVLGINWSVDAAMIKITTRGEYPFVEVGNSDELKMGQWTVAMGHPGGYHRGRPAVVRLGRIIHLGPIVDKGPKMIVSTNTLVGGDSGGPLFDLDGKVIGIHSRIGESTTANIHVPAEHFTKDWDRFLKGDVWGIKPKPGGTSMLGIFAVDHPKGALIQAVLPGSTSAKAGVRMKDIITAFDGLTVRNNEQLIQRLMEHNPGEEVRLDILRGEEKLQIKVKLSAAQ